MPYIKLKDNSSIAIDSYYENEDGLSIYMLLPIEEVKDTFSSRDISSMEFYDDTGGLLGIYDGYTAIKKLSMEMKSTPSGPPMEHSCIVLKYISLEEKLDLTEARILEKTNALNTKTSAIETKVIELDAAINPVVDTESMTLKELKQYRINESKQLLAEYLSNNPLNSDCHNQTMGTYSITKEKQDLMISNYITYQIKKQTEPNTELTWNETGKSCELWTEAEFLELICQVEQKVKPRVSKQQALEEEIMDCKTKEEVSAVVIGYVNV